MTDTADDGDEQDRDVEHDAGSAGGAEASAGAGPTADPPPAEPSATEGIQIDVIGSRRSATATIRLPDHVIADELRPPTKESERQRFIDRVVQLVPELEPRRDELMAALVLAVDKQIINRPKKPAKAPRPTPSIDPTKPQITVDVAKVRAVVDEAEQALLDRGVNIYCRGRSLVHIVRDATQRVGRHRPPDAPFSALVGPAHLTELLTDVAAWVQTHVNQHGVDTKSVLPPSWAVAALMQRGSWRLRRLEGIVEIPILRADGSLHSTPGYDDATGIYFDAGPAGSGSSVGADGPAAFPDPIPHPTFDDAQRALERLLHVVCDFNWVSTADRSAWLAAVLTAVSRHLINGAVPLIHFGAPVRGAGKSLLADLVALILTGRLAFPTSGTNDAVEMAKQLLTFALEAEQLVLWDNISGSFGCDPLAMAITSCATKGRRLGENTNISCTLAPTWLSTGNNVHWKGDMGRRVLPCEIDPKVEAPEDRTDFVHPDLRGYVRAHRGVLVDAALTILRAHRIAGAPLHGGAKWGSFEAWDDTVRSAILWLGEPDPNETRARMAEVDEDLALLRALLEAWHAVFGPVGVTVAQAIERARRYQPPDQPRYGAPAEDMEKWEASVREAAINNALRTAMLAVDQKSHEIPTSRAIGNKLAAWKGRIAGKSKFVHAGESHGVALWKVEKS